MEKLNKEESVSNEEEAQIEKLWVLLFRDPTKLSKEEINSLLEAKEELHDLLQYKLLAFPDNLRIAERYHKRKEELSKLSTEELKEIDKNIRLDRAAALGSLSDREEEEIGDSNFSEPPIDSTEHIVHELLRERETSESGRIRGQIESV